MAISSICRVHVPGILPPAIRVTRSQRYPHSSALFCTVNHRNLSLHVSRKSNSQLSVRSSKAKKPKPSPEESLIRILESEISKAAADDGYIVVNGDKQFSNNFPFEIEDNPGQQMVLLTREYKGETITVEVYTPEEGENRDEDEDEDEDEEEEETKSHEGDDEDEDEDDGFSYDDLNEPRVSLAINISKNSGPGLEFGCIADLDGFEIDYLSIKDTENLQPDDIAYEGPKFSNLAGDLQEALYKYLEIRGFNDNTARFLYDYMTNKDKKEYSSWLKKLKTFVEE